MEVKSLLGHREPLSRTWDLAAKIEQVQEGARKIRLLLVKDKKIDLPVIPLLVLAGPGVPDLPATGLVDDTGVRVVAYRESGTWLARVAQRPTTTAVDLATARRAADALREFTDTRHKRDAQPPTRSGSRPRSARGRLSTGTGRSSQSRPGQER